MAITRALFAGDDPTPDSVKKRMALAELLRQKGDDISHIDSPLEAIGSILQSGAAVYNDRKAQSDQKAGMSSRNAALASLLTGSSGSSSAMIGGGGMGASTANSISPGGTPQMGSGYKPSPAAGARAAAGDNTVIDRGAGSPSRQAFIESLMPAAIEASKRTGVDPRLIVAQAAQETGWGRSAPGNNYFGIKSHGKDGGQNLTTHEVVNGQRVKINDSFRTFASPADSVAGYADFLLQNPRYKPMMGAQGLDAQLEALGASGYATDPNYASSVGAIARSLPMPDLGGSPAPVQVASLDPSAGMGAASPSAAPAAAPQPAPAQQAAQAPAQPAQNPQLAQMLIGGGGGAAPPQTQTSGVSDATIAELLGNPWTEDIGQGLLQQKLQDNATNARLTRQYQIDQAKTADERRYDRAKVIDQRQYDQMTEAQKRAYEGEVRQEGYAREDSRNSYLDARQGNRDARSDLESDRNFNRAVTADQKPPTSVQEYEYARQNGFTGSFSDWETQNRRASANSVSVNTGEGDKFYENLDRKNAERFATLSDGGQDARSRIAQLDQLGTLLQQSPSGAEARIKMLLGDFGVNTEGLDSLQATTALIERMVPAQREPGSGPMSDADIAGFRRSLPRVINQPGGNELILGTTKAIAEYDIQRGEIADMVADRAITPAEGRKRLRELQNPLTGYSDLIRDLGTGGDGPRVSQTPRVDGVPVGAATSPAQPAQPSSKAEYDALPSGAMFRAPDGSVRRKR